MNLAESFKHDFIKNGDFKIFDINNNLIFFENYDGYCEKYGFDENGNEIYFQTSEGYQDRTIYDKNGNVTIIVN